MRPRRQRRRGGGGGRLHTTHLVLASVMALVAADGQRRGRLGADRVDAFKAGLAMLLGMLVFVVAGNGHAWAAGKRIADRHLV